MIRCLTGARFSMNAEVLRWTGDISTTDPDHPVGTGGDWETYQDPITGEVMNKWEPVPIDDDPATPEAFGDDTFTIPCLARGIVDGGIRVAGTTERFSDNYENIDFVKMWTPSTTVISKRDRVTNIRQRKGGVIVWMDEEAITPHPTIFNVNGVTPLFDAFNRHVENFVLLERAE